jgi:uncharacterized protein YllA (UPF0747 family)
VHEVAGLSTVFHESNQLRTRVSIEHAAEVESNAEAESLSPNVLLRPVLERVVLPTVAYVGGPSEVAYFAQVGAVAEELGVALPRVIPRWSGTVVEDHIAGILRRYEVDPSELVDPHAVLNRLARSSLPPAVLELLGALRSSNQSAFDELSGVLAEGGGSLSVPKSIVDGARASVFQRLSRFERRLVATAKKREARLSEDIATARGALYPLGKMQERALNLFPLLARYGIAFLEDVRTSATELASQVVGSPGAPQQGTAAAHAADAGT